MKKLFTLLFISILLVGTISAMNFDNIKSDISFDKVSTLKLGDNNIYYNPLWEKYKPIKIKNSFGFGKDLWSGALDEHTESCGTDCFSTMDINLAEDGSLIDDVTFLTLQDDGSWVEQPIRNYQFSLLENSKWINYNLGEKVLAGNYKVKLAGEKKQSRTVDWIIETQGKTLNEWAVWSGTGVLNESLGELTSDGTHIYENFSLDNKLVDYFQIEFKRTGGGESNLNTIFYYVNGSQVLIYNDTFVFGGNLCSPLNTYCQNNISNPYPSELVNKVGIEWWRSGGGGGDLTYTKNRRVFGITGSFIKINSPEDNYFTNSDTINFNATVDVVGSTFFNITMWSNISGTFEKNGTTITNGGFITQSVIPDGTYLWGCQACDSDGDCGFASENRTFTVDATAPTINILSPTGTINYNKIGNNLSLNWSVSDTNLDSCWFEYNNTNTTVTCADNNYSFITVAGKQNITFYANDTAGNLGSNTTSWNYKVLENYFTYNNETRVGDQEDFSLSLTLGSGYDLSSAIFHYNGYTEIPSIYSSGSNRVLNITDYSIPIFSNDTNITIYFELTLDDSTEIQTQNYTQLVNTIFLDNCSSYSNVLFNISLFDEVTQESLNGDIEFYYQLLNVPNYDTVSSTNLEILNSSNFLICSNENLTSQDFVQSIEIRYVSDGYSPELYHIQRAEITPSTTNINLYDLNESDSTEFKITYQDDTFNFIEGAIIQLQRRYISEDSYKVVEAPLTSNEGVAVISVDLDSIKYKITVVKDGQLLDTFDNIVFKCQSILTGECEQKLLGQIDPQNSIDYDTENDFIYSVTPGNNNITITYSIPSSMPSSVNIVVTQKDQWGNKTSCNKTITSSGGSIECDYDDSLDISYLELSINKDGIPVAYNTYVIDTDTGSDFLDNNFIIVVVLMLSIVGMAMTSPEWIIINAILVLLLSGMLWLVNGITFVAGLGILMWLLVAAVILILKLSKQEDR